MSSSAANALSGFLHAIVTSAPSCASRTAVSFPSPVFPPVITADLIGGTRTRKKKNGRRREGWDEIVLLRQRLSVRELTSSLMASLTSRLAALDRRIISTV